MAKKVAPVPKGYRTATPQLVVRNADAALDFYAAVLGADILSRTYADDGVTILQAEMKVGTSIVRVMDEMPAFGILSPLGFGGTAVGIHLYLADADDVWQKAIDHGAGLLMPLADCPWGERLGKFIDPFGHVWTVAKRIPVEQAAPVEPATPVAEEMPALTNESATISGFSVHEPLGDQREPSAEQAMTNQVVALAEPRKEADAA